MTKQTTRRLLKGISRGQESRLTCSLSTGKEVTMYILPDGNVRFPNLQQEIFTPDEALEFVKHIERTVDWDEG